MQPKRDIFYLLTIIILLALLGQFYYSYHYKPQEEREVWVFYNQDHQLNKEIISIIQNADQFVYFAVYTFTREDIKDALLAAKYRGLNVVGITDRQQMKAVESQKKLIGELRDKGIPVYEQDHSAIMHLKVLVTEKAYASGSFNWTSAATNLNDEVLEIGRDESIRKKYQNILEEIFHLYGKE